MENNETDGAGQMPMQDIDGAPNANATEKRHPEFRVVQPEYDTREGKTVFRDVGALWHNVSAKTGREFYTLKIGKMRLLVFPNQKLVTNNE